MRWSARRPGAAAAGPRRSTPWPIGWSGGRGGAAVPLVLHLLSRARYRTLDWGAMMFLEEGVTDRRQSPKVKQWVLLGMRMGMVGLLAVALARPIVRGQWGGLASGGRVTAVIV